MVSIPACPAIWKQCEHGYQRAMNFRAIDWGTPGQSRASTRGWIAGSFLVMLMSVEQLTLSKRIDFIMILLLMDATVQR
jgi:hypothetical protein